MTETLRCFGGPKDGELLDVEHPAVWLVPREPKDTDHLLDPLDLPRHYRYNVETFFVHDTSRCEAPIHAWCRSEARCLVGEDHPKGPIIDAINAVTATTFALASANWAKAPET